MLSYLFRAILRGYDIFFIRSERGCGMASLPNKKMRGRAILVAAALIVVGFGLVIRSLYQVQLVEGEAYKQEAMSRQLRATTINANRGTIYSADGQVLAASATSWRVIFSRRISPMNRQCCWRTA